jgi:hypothetical protein
MLEIKQRHNGRQILVPVSILPPTPANHLVGVEGKALVDTGSTISGITRSVADALGLVGRGKRPLASAQGEGQSERFLFRIGLWPDRAVDDPPAFPFLFEDVIGFELRNSFAFEALLGMDVLRQCDFAIQRSGHCVLRFG